MQVDVRHCVLRWPGLGVRESVKVQKGRAKSRRVGVAPVSAKLRVLLSDLLTGIRGFGMISWGEDGTRYAI